ncbi:ABC transporter substrate-binding protein [Nocardioides sp. R-C-SC26]|uniref:ABC transporter substrate-binding protein n=1 Tax=Nocardioides sp. R-C-SC26 TaxID=2870414 RepID=UPI001E5E175A|nr:extracellular solute-binding protein [Nocardioides sp. R-C-SC26]
MSRWNRRRRTVAASLAVTALVLAGCTDEPQEPPAPPPPPRPVTLTFGVFGSAPEVAAYQELVDDFNAAAETISVEVESWPSSAEMVADIQSGTTVPDVFLLARADLATVVENELNVPLFGLLEERDISYGDGYEHDALEGFSANNDLQCMPYDVSPMVVYYNTDLVDFTRMRERGLPVPSESLTSWDFDQFEAAARFASRPRLGTKGLSLDPTLRSIAPFLYTGGGSLFDNDSDPRSLALASDANQETLTRVLELARNPQFTLNDAQLRKASPLAWFKRGKLAMIEGYRSLTPELRQVDGLRFDVLPIPKLDDKATIGQMTGLCIGKGRSVQRAADFLVRAISTDGASIVARAGYIVPANLAVARSEAFLQPQEQPQHAGVFNASVDSMVTLPMQVDYQALQMAVAPALRRLFVDPVIDDLGASAALIDESSRPIIDPDYVPDSPTGSPSPSPSPSSPGSPSPTQD